MTRIVFIVLYILTASGCMVANTVTDRGLAPLVRLFERKLARPLADAGRS